jgi:chromate reductase, NAD(P)H dehydrogenase (quinone)
MKAVTLIEDELKKDQTLDYEVIDPRKLILPLPGTSYENSSHEMLQNAVKAATGVLIASPEYHGGISSVMKLVIDNLGFPSSLAGKPVSLLGVAAGVIGAVKSLEQIRSIASHVGAIVLPGAVSVANVQTVFNKDGSCNDKEIEKRIRSSVTILVSYIDRHICPAITLENMVRKEQSGI